MTDNIINFESFVELKKKPKIWLCGLAAKGQLDDLKEIIEPVYSCFSGLNWVLHTDEINGPEEEYLNSRKGEGIIIRLPKFPQAFDHARNTYLFCGNIENEDWVVNLDVMEKLDYDFCSITLPLIIQQFDLNKIDAAYLHSKIFFYKLNDYTKFVGGVHEALVGHTRAVELTKFPSLEDSSLYFTNLRPQKREKNHYILHFLKYYLLKQGQRQCLDGLGQNFSDPAIIQSKFTERQLLRESFRKYCRDNNIPLTAEGFKNWLEQNYANLDATMLNFLNTEKILNDCYRHWVKKEEFEHSHKLEEMIKI